MTQHIDAHIHATLSNNRVTVYVPVMFSVAQLLRFKLLCVAGRYFQMHLFVIMCFRLS